MSEEVSDYTFSDNTLKNCKLFVPKGCKSAYEKVDPWRNFWNIEESDFRGVNDITVSDITVKVVNGEICLNGANDDVNVEVYTIGGACVYRGVGTKISDLAKGAYVVRIGNESYKVII